MNHFEQSTNIKYLSNLNEGETGEIIQVRGKPETHRYLYGMGLTMGRSVSVSRVGTTPQDTALTVRAGDKVATIERNMADNIKVQTTR
jgi:Fe2+ transport system protein FeoA